MNDQSSAACRARAGRMLCAAALALLTALDAFGSSSSPLLAAAVASPDRYGALAAQTVLREGGDAVDAAVAMAFTLAVTFPEAVPNVANRSAPFQPTPADGHHVLNFPLPFAPWGINGGYYYARVTLSF
jgi:hypothetical protein